MENFAQIAVTTNETGVFIFFVMRIEESDLSRPTCCNYDQIALPSISSYF
jgi:hypothetical protein